MRSSRNLRFRRYTPLMSRQLLVSHVSARDGGNLFCEQIKSCSLIFLAYRPSHRGVSHGRYQKSVSDRAGRASQTRFDLLCSVNLRAISSPVRFLNFQQLPEICGFFSPYLLSCFLIIGPIQLSLPVKCALDLSAYFYFRYLRTSQLE